MPADASLPDRLRALLDDPRVPRSAAAFDADGTLWAGDVGELVLQAMIGLGRAPHTAFAEYERILAVDAPRACALCVELMRGLGEDELLRWSRELIQSGRHGPLFPAIVGFAQALQARGAEVWIVSGSNAWTVREGARAIGLEPARVLALTTPVNAGVLSGVVDRPITCAAGKVEALRAATSRPLLLAAGNALYDVDLLEAAEIPLAVAPRSRATPLRALAERRAWHVVDV